MPQVGSVMAPSNRIVPPSARATPTCPISSPAAIAIAAIGNAHVCAFMPLSVSQRLPDEISYAASVAAQKISRK